MFIEPNSTIKILRDVPLDITYEHTIYFDNITDQYNYFNSKVKPTTFPDTNSYTLTKQSYTRPSSNQIRIEIVSDKLYDCNYIMFQNTNFGSKWFYAFIKKITYINNQVSVIDFELDVMQTWFFNYHLKMSFVDREHSSSDNLFDNIIEESLDAGAEYETAEKQDVSLNDMVICGEIAPYASGTINGVVVDNVYYCGTPFIYDINDPNDIANLNTLLSNVSDSQQILSMYQAPKTKIHQSVATISCKGSGTISNFGTYTPKNNKLYIYPYNVVVVSNNAGNSAIYKFENSEFSDIEFMLDASNMGNAEAFLYPHYYRGVNDDYESGLTLNNFPVCGWLTDTYKAWWAQNQSSYVNNWTWGAVEALLGVGQIAVGINEDIPGGGGLGKLASGFKQIATAVSKKNDVKAIPPQANGHFVKTTLNARMNRTGFSIYHQHIKEEYARIIDDFFTKYGYACKRVKYPNRKSRRYWTFIKTIGCVIEGNMPCDDEKAICDIYDNGITFWKYTSGETLKVGDYSQNNTVTGVEGG